MKKFKKLITAALVLCLLVSCLTACGGNAAKDPAETGTAEAPASGNASSEERKVCKIATGDILITLDPQDATVSANSILGDMIFDTLVISEQDGVTFTKNLATDWTESDDGLTYTFKIVEGAYFWDGTPLTAEDVAFTFQRLIDNPTLQLASNSWKVLESVEAPDATTFVMHLNAPCGSLLTRLSGVYILSKAAYAEYGDKLFTDQIMNGSGKWKFVEWVDGEYVHVEKNENYWNGGNDSYYDDVYLYFVTEASTAISAQITGNMDAYLCTTGISTDMLRMYDGYEDKVDVFTYDTASQFFIQFHVVDTPFADVNVRRAFSMAIDRQLIADSVMEGGAAATGITNQYVNGYDPDFHCEWYDYDPEAAAELLAKTDYKGEEILINSKAGDTNCEKTILAICEMVNKVGFNCRINILEAAAFSAANEVGDYDAWGVTVGFSGGDYYMIANVIRYDIWTSFYENEELNAAIEAADKTADPAARNEYFCTMNQIASDECAPFIGICRSVMTQSVNKGVTGVKLYPTGKYELKDISFDPALVK